MLHSLVRVSRRVRGATDLLGREMQTAIENCSLYEFAYIPVRREARTPRAASITDNFTTGLRFASNSSCRKLRRKCVREADGTKRRVIADQIRPGRPPPRLSLPPSETSRAPPFTTTQFHVLLNSLFKVLFNLPSRYLFAIGLGVIFSLTRSLPRTLGCTPKQPDSREKSAQQDSRLTGLSPSTGHGHCQVGL